MSGVPVVHTKLGEKIVAYFSTRNLYGVLPAAYKSLLHHTPNVHVYCFIEDDDLPYKTPPQVTCVNVKGQTLFPPEGPCFKSSFTHMILLKAALTKIFTEADRALILDVDTIVCDDISALWDHDLSHAYYAAVKEPRSTLRVGVPYANFGVVMLNLDKLRKSGKDNMIIEELNTHYHMLPEQDAFNLICMNRFDPLPPEYNVTFDGITDKAERTVIQHFAGIKDWSGFDIVKEWLNREE